LHPASAFQEIDEAALRARIESRGLALNVGCDQGRPRVAHSPVRLDGDRLRFHLSIANRLTAALRTTPYALAVVSDGDAYISPDWYEMADQVPTWNYLSAEIEGPVRILEKADAARLLDDLSAQFEARLAPKTPWTRAKMSPGRFEAMLEGIVAFEMTIERLAGITKLSQNKPAPAIERLASRLADRPDEASRRIAARMKG
jgi:transcriptional regulator